MKRHHFLGAAQPLVRHLIGAVAIVFTVNGCFINDHHDDDNHHYDDDVAPAEPSFVTIDRNNVLSTELGYGAGFFVEYAEGGIWTVWTSCDTELTGNACYFEAVIASQAPIQAVEDVDLEGFDRVSVVGDDGLSIYSETTNGRDMVTFTTAPGALVQMAIALDGFLAPGYFVWFGNGVVQDGAPSSPVVFQPDAP
jgi:hypothetical protein